MAEFDDLVQLQVLNAMEEFELEVATRRRIFTKMDAFDLPDNQFRKLFRLTKNLAEELIETVEPFMVPASRKSALDVTTKVLTALKFYASGSYQTDVGMNVYTAVSQPSVSRCVKEVSRALNNPNVFGRSVVFPHTADQLSATRNGFYEKYGFPGVVGCIDCTHVAIIAPKDNENAYFNRKNYHSINVQLVCDSTLKIINCSARFPGSSHDSYIWNNSNLKDFFINLHANRNHNYFLLGDSGYALRTYLQTPISRPEPAPDTPEYRYNTAQIRTRSIIERCNGVLKCRFRCLLKHRVLHYEPEVACSIINSCIVLHNLCIQNNLPEPDPEEGDDELDFGLMEDEEIANLNEIRRVNPDLALGRALQRKIITNFFA